jgi:hypothetical protein
MASAEWYLKIRQGDNDWVKIEIDPAAVYGIKGQLGRTLCLPYKLSGQSHNTRVIFRLISLEGSSLLLLHFNRTNVLTLKGLEGLYLDQHLS